MENTRGVPTIGRIIFVVADIGTVVETFPAIVTRVDGGGIWFTAFAPGKAPNTGKVPTASYGKTEGCWHWLEAVAEAARNSMPYAPLAEEKQGMVEQQMKKLEDAADLTSWEINFLDSIKKQWERSHSLTPKQIGILARIYGEKG